jgi:hypothetical protein
VKHRFFSFFSENNYCSTLEKLLIKDNFLLIFHLNSVGSQIEWGSGFLMYLQIMPVVSGVLRISRIKIPFWALFKKQLAE